VVAIEAPKELIARLDRMGCAYRLEEPLRLHTSFAIGGPAEIFAEPQDEDRAAQVLAACRELGVSVFVMGNGTNLLAPDEGVRGVVLAFGARMSKIAREENSVVFAQSGATLSQLCRFAQKSGLSGLEFAWGIPGSVGGAVTMNAGAYGGEIKDVVRSVTFLDDSLNICEIGGDEAGFSYRTSCFQQNGAVIVGARFALCEDDPDAIDARMRDIIARRTQKQPLDLPSAGSAFRRPAGSFAAKLIEDCGLKGFCVGGAQVSPKHAGFIVNTGGASCADVLTLCGEIRRIVSEKTGILLEPEIKRM
jgi:UDP-N-acetylmuramate dehydrogenase